MNSRSVHVAKLGGSLLDLPDLPRVLTHWLERQKPTVWVLIAGGGTLANAVRDIDQRFELNAAALHWACIDVLNGTARVVAAMLPDAALITCFDQLLSELRSGAGGVLVFTCGDFLHREAAILPPPSLPHDWRVTSDSIAARLAFALEARELVLLKSKSMTAVETVASAARNNLVDEYFPIAAMQCPNIRWVNLRNGYEQRLR